MSTPVVNGELFGFKFAGENYGAIVVVDALANYAYNVIFGRVWDANRSPNLLLQGAPRIVCHGPQCLLATFITTSVTTGLALCAMLFLRWIMYKRDLERGTV